MTGVCNTLGQRARQKANEQKRRGLQNGRSISLIGAAYNALRLRILCTLLVYGALPLRLGTRLVGEGATDMHDLAMSHVESEKK
jgi:hypothetical protein